MNQQTNQPLQENAFIEKVNEFDLLTIFKTDKMSAFFEDADSLKQNVQNIIQETAELLKSSSGLLRDSKKWIAGHLY